MREGAAAGPSAKRPAAPEPGKPTLRHRILSGLKRVWSRRHPPPGVRRGAGCGVIALAALLAVVLGSRITPGLGRILDPALGVVAGLLVAALAAAGVLLGLAVLRDLPRYLGRWGLAAAGVLVLLLLAVLELPPPAALGFSLGLVLLEGILGGGLVFLLGGGWKRSGVAARAVVLALVLAAAAGNVWLVSWLAGDGSGEHLVAAPEGIEPPPADSPFRLDPATPDPAAAGPHPVLTLTYGSGDDRRRPEFGAAAALTTEPVDASPFVKGNEGWRIDWRHWYWGFDFERVPLNGRVWYPDGDGPFPLALIVHGNHNLAELSDPGYGYLGELLASRGTILVSVDENFFNGSWLGGLERENDARGWLLLEHLAAWREWNATPGNPFHGKVDLDRIALMGHSRGGEAAAVAASFNRLERYPDDATVELPSGFAVRAVVAIAPSDGQYQPADRLTPLADVDYLVLQGAHDADVSIYAGIRQLERLAFTGDGYHFKTGLYAYRANHGQFNTVWGRTDYPWPLSLFLNLEPLLPGEEQRRLGAVAISAFLEVSLRGDRRYLPLFRDHRTAASWLPVDRYISRFEDSTFRNLADFEEDVDVTTASAAGARLAGEGLAVWREELLDWRQADRRFSQENGVVYLGWRAPEAEAASYTLALPAELAAEWGVGPATLLVFSAADSGDEPPEPDEEGEEESDGEEEEESEGAGEEGERAPLDFTVELETLDGQVARLPLSRFRALSIPLEARFTKLWAGAEETIYGDAWEPTLQTFELPLAAFAAAAPGFDPARLAAVRFVFDRTPEGVLIVDRIGFAAAAPPAGE